MTPIEAVKLSGYVEQMCPQQRFNEYTGDAWADLMPDIRYEDALEACKILGRKQVFIAVAEIIAEVKRIRAKRIDDHGPIVPPPDLDPDDPIAYRDWWRDSLRAIGDGTFEPAGELEGLRERPVRQITQNAFKEPR